MVLAEVMQRIWGSRHTTLRVDSDEQMKMWQTIALAHPYGMPPELECTTFVTRFRWGGKLIESELRNDWDEHVQCARAAGWVN